MSALVDTTNTNKIVSSEDTAKPVVQASEASTEEETTALSTAVAETNEETAASENNPVDAEKKAAETADKATEESVDTVVISSSEVVTVVAKVASTSTETVVATSTETVVATSTETVVAISTQEAVEVSGEVNEDGKEDPMEEEVSEEISPEETKKKIADHLIAGRRHMKTNAFNEAAEALSVAATLAAELFGEGHEDTFEPNFLYGKALLELAKMEDGVLTNALTDIPKASEDDEEVQDDVVENPDNVPQEERAEIKQKVEEALGVESGEATKESVESAFTEEIVEEKEVEEGKQLPEEEATAETTEDVDMEAAEEQTAEDGPADTTADDQAEESDAEDDGDSMKLAWELLETSRCICEKKLKSLEASTDEATVTSWKINHAEVLTSLGEHGVADSKYEQARKDLMEAVAIQSVHLPPTSRILANTKHLLAKAFSLDSLFQEASTHFSESKDILLAKVDELKKQVASASDEEKEELQSEIKELEEVIPDLEALVADARASAEQIEKMKAAAKKELESVAAEIAKMEGEEVKDITDLVRRPTKRAASEGPVEEAKKRKSEDGVAAKAEEKSQEPVETSTASADDKTEEAMDVAAAKANDNAVEAMDLATESSDDKAEEAVVEEAVSAPTNQE
uniref:SHNi-TPR domain-containing protein n=1 Tax=Caenorhabditis tropicalis TaxID=1561998 RepID=A0A1I7UIV2_9PELO